MFDFSSYCVTLGSRPLCTCQDFLGSGYLILRASLPLWPNYMSVPRQTTTISHLLLLIMFVIPHMQETWSSVILIMIVLWVAQPDHEVRLAYRGARGDAVCRSRSWLSSSLIFDPKKKMKERDRVL